MLVEFLCINTEKAFLDLGANDGITGSSTYNLEKKMWRGILVEPNLQLVANLQASRESCVLAVGVGASTEIQTLLTSHIHTLGTMVSDKNGYEYQRLCRESGGEQNVVKQAVAVLSIKRILHIYRDYLGIEPSFVKLDVEGLEMAVLQGLLATECRPFVIEVENNTRSNAWADVLNKSGYNLIAVLDSFVEIWIYERDPLPTSLSLKGWLQSKAATR